MKRVPAMRGTIERRLLVNYRVDPAVLGRVLPAPFRPQLVGDVGMAGICLIRLGHLRPVGLPASIGFTTENAAHRVAVEWDGPDGLCHGVYIPRRDTSSVLTRVVGGRLFPGEHFRSNFIVREQGGRYEVAFTSADGSARVAVTARDVARMPAGSVFASLAEASTFFQAGSLGYSANKRAGRLDGLELCSDGWHIEPVLIEQAESSFFEDEDAFPAGAAVLDSAFVMRDMPAVWKAHPPLVTISSARR